MPNTTTATEFQRNYRKVIKMVKKIREPVTVLSNNKPDIVVIDYDVFADLLKILPRKKVRQRRSLDELFGSWTKKEADEFDKFIEDAFEQINPESWK